MVMNQQKTNKPNILIADDSRLNRMILSEMLKGDFETVEVANGADAIAIMHDRASDFSLLLLDLNLPDVDGFEILATMNRYHWIDNLPVIVITDEKDAESIERAYDFGVTDYIERPYDAATVQRRVYNAMVVSLRQKRLVNIVTDQIIEKEKSDKMMIAILSQIVEFRNGESRQHVLHIGAITETLLHCLAQKTDRYDLTPARIDQIATASALHDIGKISIPEEILNKPGNLTPDEFEILKQHPRIGAEILSSLSFDQQTTPLMKTAIEICRWHHERYDGSGYPDGLYQDTIPISAQVVALADAYDALTSERCYKSAYSHQKAVQMIRAGECGAFNPLLIECLEECSDLLQKDLERDYLRGMRSTQDTDKIADQIRDYELSYSEQLVSQLSQERQKTNFLIGNSDEPIFIYTTKPELITLNRAAARLFGTREVIIDPDSFFKNQSSYDFENFGKVHELLEQARPDRPEFETSLDLRSMGLSDHMPLSVRTMWSGENYIGAIGKFTASTPPVSRRPDDPGPALSSIGIRTRKLSAKQMYSLYTSLEKVFDFIRIIDFYSGIPLKIRADGTLIEYPEDACMKWCENLSCSACVERSRLDEIQQESKRSDYCIYQNQVYQILSSYLEVDDRPLVLQAGNHITDEGIINSPDISRLQDSLYMDPVVGCYNRRYYEEKVGLIREDDTLAMIDINGFKRINDAYGHHTGDAILHQIVSMMSSVLSDNEIMIRYGGDEFIVIFHDCLEREALLRLGKIADAVENLRPPGSEQHLSISYGAVQGPGSPGDLMEQADRLMYEDKQKRRRAG